MLLNFIGDCVFRSQSELDAFLKILKQTDAYKVADFVFVNLEAPIVSSDASQIVKFGPHLKCPEKLDFRGEKKIIWCLANNHMMDYGLEGLIDCIKNLQEQDQKFIGLNKQGHEHVYLPTDEGGVCIFNVCENEIGCDSFGILKIFDHLEIAKKVFDAKRDKTKVVIYIHGGVEHTAIPSPEQKNICTKLLDLGVDAVIYSHSHKISRMFTVNNKLICYGLGNFYFDNCLTPQESYLDQLRATLLLDICLLSKSRYQFIAVDDSKVNMELVNQELRAIEEIENSAQKYNRYWDSWTDERLPAMLVHTQLPKFFRGSARLMSNKILRNLVTKPDVIAHKLNILSCASLREIYIAALKKHLSDETGK